MMVGIGLIGVLTATVASFFVQEHTDANKEQLQAAPIWICRTWTQLTASKPPPVGPASEVAVRGVTVSA